MNTPMDVKAAAGSATMKTDGEYDPLYAESRDESAAGATDGDGEQSCRREVSGETVRIDGATAKTTSAAPTLTMELEPEFRLVLLDDVQTDGPARVEGIPHHTSGLVSAVDPR